MHEDRKLLTLSPGRSPHCEHSLCLSVDTHTHRGACTSARGRQHGNIPKKRVCVCVCVLQYQAVSVPLTSPTNTMMTQSSFSSAESLSMRECSVSARYDFTFLLTVGIPITMETGGEEEGEGGLRTGSTGQIGRAACRERV